MYFFQPARPPRPPLLTLIFLYCVCAGSGAEGAGACVCVGGEGVQDNIEGPKSLRLLLLRHCSFTWRRHSIKRRTRHHGRPINPQTKVDYDFSRGHRSRLLLRPVHTCRRAHRFSLLFHFVLRARARERERERERDVYTGRI